MKEGLLLLCQKSIKNLDYQAFADVLKSCAAILDLNLGRTLHSHVIRQGHGSCHLVSKALLNMYAKCNALDHCQHLFDQMECRDTVAWNIVLSGLAASPVHDVKAMSLFRSMHASEETSLSTVSFAIILPVCARVGSLRLGQTLHGYAAKVGFDSDTLVGNALVSMYAKSGFALNAYQVFDGIADKDVISWNAIIAGLAENELVDDAFGIFQGMLKGNYSPDYATVMNVLPLCARLREKSGHFYGMEIHAYVLRRAELATAVPVLNALISFYVKIGQLEHARTLFKKMKTKDLVSWNSQIAGYASNGEWSEALDSFYELVVNEKMAPDPVTLVSILPSCAQLFHLRAGKQIHGYVVRRPSLLGDTNVQNALVSFYSKCGLREAALKTFLLIPRKDLVSWNAILDCLSQNESETNLLCRMFTERVQFDSVTILTIVRFCNYAARMDFTKEAHGFSLKHGVLLSDDEPTMVNSLINAYAKCGNLDYARRLFESMSGSRNLVFQKMSPRDLTSWNLMLRVYAMHDCPSEALSLFHEMQNDGAKPDAMSIMSLLPVCAQFAFVNMLRQCHGYVTRACFADVHLMAALLDTYSKCGSINYAAKLFQSSTTQKDLVLFTAMIGGYATNGMGKEAIRVFHHFLESGLKPDRVIITMVLSACNHSGLVDEGLEIFDSIEQVHHMKPSVEQYACLVDLLARGGRIKDAYSLACKMPVEASSNVWGTLLGACAVHHEVEMAQSIIHRLRNSTDVGNYVAMSNMYAVNASWDGVVELRKLMRSKDLKKPSGCSAAG